MRQGTTASSNVTLLGFMVGRVLALSPPVSSHDEDED